MRNYDRVHPRKPEGIEERKAYIVGGGIAGLTAAAFLVRDAQMPGKNITVYDQLPVFGGSMDAAGSAANDYVSRVASVSWSRTWSACGICSAASLPSMRKAAPCRMKPVSATKTGRLTPSTACGSRASFPTTSPLWVSLGDPGADDQNDADGRRSA